MKRPGHDNLIALTCLVTCACALYVASTSRPVTPQSPQARHDSPATAKAAPEVGNGELNRKVEDLTRELKQKAVRLESVMAQLQSARPQRQPNDVSLDASAAAMAQVEAPTAAPPSASGVAFRPNHFNALSDPDGDTIANDVTFQARYGRRLAFRDSDNRPFAVDIDDVHPGVLGHLGIDRDDAMADARRDQTARRALAEAAARRREQRAELARREANAKPEAAPAPSMAAPTQVTHVNIQSPAPAAPVYSQPGTYWTCQPHWRSGHRRSWNPGVQVAVPVSNSTVASFQSPSSQTPYSPPRYPFNNGFRFTRTGPYTTIPGY